MRNKKVIVLSVVILVLIGIFILFSNKNEEVDNIFSYTVKVTDGKFSPTNMDFFITKEELLKTLNSKRKAWFEDKGRLGKYVYSEFELEGLSNKVLESCVIEEVNAGEEIFLSVSYHMTVTPEEKESFCSSLYQQAKEYMPKTLSDDPNSLELIKHCEEQMNIIWKGDDNSYVYLSVPATPDIDGDVIILQITSPKEPKI